MVTPTRRPRERLFSKGNRFRDVYICLAVFVWVGSAVFPALVPWTRQPAATFGETPDRALNVVANLGAPLLSFGAYGLLLVGKKYGSFTRLLYVVGLLGAWVALAAGSASVGTSVFQLHRHGFDAFLLALVMTVLFCGPLIRYRLFPVPASQAAAKHEP